MIRRLEESDREMTLAFLSREPGFNIFIIGDIGHHGMEQDFQRLYGAFDEGEIQSVFLRYREHAVFYAPDDRFDEGYLDVFEQDPFEHISGKTSVMDTITGHLDGFKVTKTSFLELDRSCMPSEIAHVPFRIASDRETFKGVHDLLVTIDSFDMKSVPEERFVKEQMASRIMGMTLVLEEDGKVVSTARTTAETPTHAMVVAVATRKGYRNKGYAGALVGALAHAYVHDKGKSLCLFYDNPGAGSIYHRLGFRHVGEWTMADRIAGGNGGERP
jgi:uncharacterized protein